MKKLFVFAAGALLAAACTTTPSAQDRLTVHDKEIDAIIAQMTLEEKVEMLHSKTNMSSAGVERLGIADTIEWLGYVNNEAKFRIYSESRVFVHPTVFDNNGMVAAEALCTGLPVVMQDLPALRDVYTTGCLKVPFGDRNAFAEAVVSLLTDPAKYAATAPTSDQLAALRAHWKWESRAAKFDRWLDSLLSC